MRNYGTRDARECVYRRYTLQNSNEMAVSRWKLLLSGSVLWLVDSLWRSCNWLQSVTYVEMIRSWKKKLLYADERKCDVIILC